MNWPRTPRWIGLTIAVLVLLGSPLSAQEFSSDARLSEGEAGQVASVVDGDTLILESGTEVRLVGIQAPKLPLGRANFKAWPLADDAKALLERLSLNQPVTLYFGGREQDRYGRALAHVVRADGLWLQGAMLDAGLARVYSFRDNRALIAEMLIREQVARQAWRGMWDHPAYAIQTPETAPDLVDSFQLIEGRVLDAAVVRRRGYINFGPDYRTDFTIVVQPADRRRFEAAGREVESYIGHWVRVRGWVKSYNGPMIEATHPEQIEVLD